jgi:hypothetical protein
VATTGEAEMKRLLGAAAVMTALGCTWFASTLVAASTSTGGEIEARLGDRIRVVGAPVACRVVRMSELGGRVVVDCRRGGTLEGTYGTLLSSREAVLVRYESSRAANQVAVGVHEAEPKRCTRTSR